MNEINELSAKQLLETMPSGEVVEVADETEASIVVYFSNAAEMNRALELGFCRFDRS